jgi:hypothetical protein
LKGELKGFPTFLFLAEFSNEFHHGANSKANFKLSVRRQNQSCDVKLKETMNVLSASVFSLIVFAAGGMEERRKS